MDDTMRVGWEVRVESLSVWLGDKLVLRGVTTLFKPGQVTALMGPSGSGKSTLLRVLNRLLELREEAKMTGRVLVEGRDQRSLPAYWLRRRMAIVFQHPVVFPHLSIYENVAIAARLALREDDGEMGEDDVERLVKWSLQQAMLWDEVADRLEESPLGLSGGQRQRLALARALAQRPRVLLLDEPTANLDPRNTLSIERSVKAQAERGVTIVMVTHSPQQALRVGDWGVFLHEGRILEEAPVNRLVREPSNPLVREYLSL